MESKLAEYKKTRDDAVKPVVTPEMLEFRKNVAYWASMTDEEARKAKLEAYTKERDDLETPTKLTAGYVLSNFGTDLDAIEPFTTELTGIVDKMKEELANETRILEGTDVPEYNQNELSDGETKVDQWKSVLPNGSWTTGLTHTSTPESNSLYYSVRHNSPVSPTLTYGATCSHSSTTLWGPTWADCGRGIDAMNESSECTVPMISELTLGTPNEEK